MQKGEQISPEDITCVYLAKKLAPHLKIAEIKVPIPAKMKLSITFTVWPVIFSALDFAAGFYEMCAHPKEYFQERKYMKRRARDEKRTEAYWCKVAEEDKRKREEELKNAGIVTPEEKNALIVTTFAGRCLERLIYHAEAWIERGDFTFEISHSRQHRDSTGSTETIVDEVRMDKETLQKVVALSIRDGIVYIEDHYYGVPLYKGMPRQFRNINPDFEEKATSILLAEIHLKIEGGTEIGVLEKVAVRKGSNGKIYMRDARRPTTS